MLGSLLDMELDILLHIDYMTKLVIMTDVLLIIILPCFSISVQTYREDQSQDKSADLLTIFGPTERGFC